MPNRIIDQTESTTIVGTESIPGTEQTSTGETTPKNVRWTWNTVKTWIYSIIGQQEIVTLEFEFAGSQTYQVSRYQMVKGYVWLWGDPGETLKIENNLSGAVYLDTETPADCGDINYYTQAANATQRVLKVTLSAPGTVKLFTTKNLL